jgi:hypothetical protein
MLREEAFFPATRHWPVRHWFKCLTRLSTGSIAALGQAWVEDIVWRQADGEIEKRTP